MVYLRTQLVTFRRRRFSLTSLSGLRSEVRLPSTPVLRLAEVLSVERASEVQAALNTTATRLDGRTVWHVSANGTRGGVAELLHGNLPYHRGAGISTRWVTLHSPPGFRDLTKTLYYSLCGAEGPEVGATLERRRNMYEGVCRENASRLVAAADRASVFIAHDHHTAGLLPLLRDAGHMVMWRMHFHPALTQAAACHAWQFLLPYLQAAHAVIVSSHSPDLSVHGLDAPIRAVLPSIDPFVPKNAPIERETAVAVAVRAGVVRTTQPHHGPPDDVVASGTRISTSIVREGSPPLTDVPLITQVSRWDRVKDGPGVIRAFVDHVDPAFGAHLMLVGPGTEADPGGAQAFDACLDVWSGLGLRWREQIHLVRLGMEDAASHGIVVNAIQRLSKVITQKSLAEGFGLTVAEAGWKGQPVVASAVGGIRCQVEDGKTGLLIDDPGDLSAFGKAINSLLADDGYTESMGQNARQRVRRKFLTDSQLLAAADALADLIGGVGHQPA